MHLDITTIRIASGIGAAAVFFLIVWRRRRKAEE
jgi:hypothetical protein